MSCKVCLPRGKQGPVGATGPAGPSGASIAGSPGVVGVTGPSGSPIQGVTGPSGVAGQSIVGPSGPTGPTPSAEQGPSGVQGLTGPSLQGVSGASGATGVGAAGSPGVSGPSGLSLPGLAGATGPVPLSHAFAFTTAPVVVNAGVNVPMGTTFGVTPNASWSSISNHAILNATGAAIAHFLVNYGASVKEPGIQLGLYNVTDPMTPVLYDLIDIDTAHIATSQLIIRVTAQPMPPASTLVAMRFTGQATLQTNDNTTMSAFLSIVQLD